MRFIKKELISRMKEFHLSNKDIKHLILLNEYMSSKEISMLYNEFDFDKTKIENSIKSYRNIVIIFDLIKEDESFLDDWNLFLSKYYPKKDIISRFDNIIVNKDLTNLLLITNKRLIHIDIKKLNEEISRINKQISLYNEKANIDEIVVEDKKGVINSILSAFRK